MVHPTCDNSEEEERRKSPRRRRIKGDRGIQTQGGVVGSNSSNVRSGSCSSSPSATAQPHVSSSRNRPYNSLPANELCNFRFASTPLSSHHHHHHDHDRRKKSTTGKAGEHNRSKTAMIDASFPLFHSAQHSFALTRRGFKTQQYSFQGLVSSESSVSVSWETVRLVQYYHQSSNNADEEATCPICLCALSVPRITKCGHLFCLSCLLQYYHHHHHHHAATTTTSNNTTTTTTNTIALLLPCPCCFAPLHLEDVRPCRITTLMNHNRTPPRVGSTLSFIKLHRVKTCSAPYVPVVAPTPPSNRDSSSHYYSGGIGPKHAHPSALPQHTDPDARYSKFTYIDPTDLLTLLLSQYNLYHNNEADALDDDHTIVGPMMMTVRPDSFIQNEVDRLLREQDDERALQTQFFRSASGFYVPLPHHLLYGASPCIRIHTDNDTTRSATAVANVETEPEIHGHESAEADTTYCPTQHACASGQHCTTGTERVPSSSRSSSSSSSASTTLSFRSKQQQHRSGKNSSNKHSNTNTHDNDVGGGRGGEGCMFLDPDVDDEYVFYQTMNGTLCFLSAFNMKCLQAEFTTYAPSRTGRSPPCSSLVDVVVSQPSVRAGPLPDVLHGTTVVHVERCVLHADAHKRWRFLSHLPLYTEIYWVEVTFGGGGGAASSSKSNVQLSPHTKKQFARAFQQRQQQRNHRHRIEQRHDTRLQCLEQERIRALKDRFRRIDTTDDFFHPPLPMTQPVQEQEPELERTGEEMDLSLLSFDSSPRENSSNAALNPPSAVLATTARASTFSQAVRRGIQRNHPEVLSRDEIFPTLLESSLRGDHGDPIKRNSSAGIGSPTFVLSSYKEQHHSNNNNNKKKNAKTLLFSTGGHRGTV